MYEIGQEEIDAVAEVIRSKSLFRYRGGEDGPVAAVERLIPEMIGCTYALTVTSGTGALICALVGLEIGPGDEVIVPAYTWLASAGAVLCAGAIPVLAEVDETLTLDPEDFERRIGPRTRAVMPVHMRGRPCNMDAIMAVAKKHEIKVVEDACQAVGGSYKGRRLTTLGDAGAFSFNQFKNIACGEGGALLTSNRTVYERALYHHDLGCAFRKHDLAGDMGIDGFLGNTYRMNNILGAILKVQFERLDSILDRLRHRRDRITKAVREAGAGLTFSPSNDIEGDCGNFISFVFPTIEEREQAAQRVKALRDDVVLKAPIEHGLHVYTRWTMLLEGRGGHHPAVNPFLMPENKECRTKITEDCCPKTLDILKRTGMLSVNIDWTDDECDAIADVLCKAAG